MKPEIMTHLNSRQIVSKAHPRIALRGQLDLLESQIILAQVQLSHEGIAAWDESLCQALALVRSILTCEVLEKPLEHWELEGMDSSAVHAASHHPEHVWGKGHILPEASHGLPAALMNWLRAASRQAELAAVHAFCTGDAVERPDLLEALNRLSSYFYVLQLRAAAANEHRISNPT